MRYYFIFKKCISQEKSIGVRKFITSKTKIMELFVEENSVVRKIWGKSDTVLFIFSGASAEFALNKAVDWLYFTGKLPSDPLADCSQPLSMQSILCFHQSMTLMLQLML